MLKALMIKRSIDLKRAELEELRKRETEFETREAELEAAINEAAAPDEQAAVAESVEKFDADKAAYEENVNTLSAEIEQLEADLAAIEAEAPSREAKIKNIERTDNKVQTTINIRELPMSRRAFDALPEEMRNSIVQKDEVKSFLAQLRSMKGTNRAVTGGELTIPVVFLDLIAENMFRYSKLLNRVRIRYVGGQARQTIAGTLLDDNDIDLSGWIVEMLSESIGYAMDKAILYGKGSAAKMPLGIVTRLAQTTQPSDYPATAPAWVDLHESNVLEIGGEGVTGAEFWAELMQATGATYTRYSRGNMFWAMNSKTYATLRSKVITFTASGDIVSNIFGVLPIITGDVDILEFMPDGDIVGGYGDLYLLAMRSGLMIESSYHVEFLQDNTVFRAKQRADGQPIIPGAFVAININGEAVTTVIDFAADTANDAQLTGLTIAGVTLSPTFSPTTYSYNGGTATSNSAKVEATPAQAGAKVAIAVNGANLRNGGTATLTASAANTITATVTQGNAVRVYTVTVTGAAS